MFEILTGFALQNFSKDCVQIVRAHLSDLNVHSISNRVGQRLNSVLYFSIEMGILTIYKKPDLFWTLLNYNTLKLWSHPFQHRESRCGEFYTYLCLNTYEHMQQQRLSPSAAVIFHQITNLKKVNKVRFFCCIFDPPKV